MPEDQEFKGQVGMKVKVKGTLNFHCEDGSVEQRPFEGEAELKQEENENDSLSS